LRVAKYVLINCIAPLIISFLVYIFFRPDVTIISKLLGFLNPNRIYFNNKLIGLLPDLLSLYAINSFLIIWLRKNYIFSYSIFLFCVISVFEVGQAFFDYGTFDFLDIILYLMGIIFSYTLLHKLD